MKNVVICKNCRSENPFHGLICQNCKSYLRERIYNLDLWKTTGHLIETPSKGFKTIIFSEHKNYLILLLILIAGKFFLNGIFLTIYFDNWNAYLPGYFSSYIIFLIFSAAVILIFSGIFTLLTKVFGVETKLKDNIAILTYSFLPYTFGFLILFPMELVIFGSTLFYHSPSPFLLKPAIAYSLLAFEGLIILWSLFLTYYALKVQSANNFYSLAFAVFIHLTLYLILYFIASAIYL
jgi:hypothetical protein